MGGGASITQTCEKELKELVETLDGVYLGDIKAMEAEFADAKREFELRWDELPALLKSDISGVEYRLKYCFRNFVEGLASVAQEIGLTNAADVTFSVTVLTTKSSLVYSMADLLPAELKKKSHVLVTLEDKASTLFSHAPKLQETVDKIGAKAVEMEAYVEKCVSGGVGNALVAYANACYACVVAALTKCALSLVFGGSITAPHTAQNVTLSESVKVNIDGIALFGVGVDLVSLVVQPPHTHRVLLARGRL